MDLTPTPSQTAGPFLHLGLTDTRSVSLRCRRGSERRASVAHLSVLDGDGVPVPDAMIELWQADSEGNYKDGSGGRRNFRWLWTIGDVGRWIVHF